MKKNYIAPKTKIVTVELQQMIAASPGNTVLDKNETPITESEGIGSRRSNYWDDEDY